jgi:predicted dehydrogenase
MAVLRFGVIGTARVVSYGLVQPARSVPDLQVEAVASRSIEKARSFASLHTIPLAFGSYEQLLDDKSIDAVYIALPTALHAEWVRKALEAGKHVLCEKPLTSTAEAAQELEECAREHNRVLQEGMHVRYLRKLERQRELVASGDLGRPLRMEAYFRAPRIPMSDNDFRLCFELGGGAGLDLGCYAVSCLRYVAGGEPEVLAARHRRAAAQVDRWMRAKCRLPSGADGVIECGFRGWYLPRVGVEVSCERGWVKWDKDGLVVKRGGRVAHEPLPNDWTFQLQLEAFAKRTRGEPSAAPPPGDAVANARVLDAMYKAAGLLPRPTTVRT